MPVDYYPNKNVLELVALLGKLQTRQTAGALTEVTAAGVRTVRAAGAAAGNSRTETEIKRVLYSLYVRTIGTDDADTYPNPYASMIRRTRARYTLS
jgi:hypothetical protein